jgi:hypothetical protein
VVGRLNRVLGLARQLLSVRLAPAGIAGASVLGKTGRPLGQRRGWLEASCEKRSRSTFGTCHFVGLDGGYAPLTGRSVPRFLVPLDSSTDRYWKSVGRDCGRVRSG